MSTNILPPPPFGTHYEATDADTANTAGAGSGSVISYGTHPGQALLPPQGTFVVTDVRSHANTPQATTLQGISFIICSIDDSKFRHISQRIGAICLQHHEIIRISDAKGLSEGYTRGIASALHDTLVLCHDDIDLLCEQAFAGILEQGLLQFDVIGVAGPRKLKSGFWLNGGPTN